YPDIQIHSGAAGTACGRRAAVQERDAGRGGNSDRLIIRRRMRVAFPSLAHKDVREEEVVTEVDSLSAAILQLLAEAPPPGGVSLPRIGKRLGLSASALLRHLTAMSDAQLAGQPGPGWVRVTQTEER